MDNISPFAMATVKHLLQVILLAVTVSIRGSLAENGTTASSVDGDDVVEKDYTALAIGVSAFFLVLVIVLTTVTCLIRRSNAEPNKYMERDDDPKAAVTVPALDKLLLDDRRIDREAIAVETTQVIGRGRFGNVMRGFLCKSGRQYHAAVKAVTGSSSLELQETFVRIAATLRSVPDHPNIVRLLGHCIDQLGVCMALEFCDQGDLKSYLCDLRSRDNAPRRIGISNSPEVTTRLLGVLQDVATAMIFLSERRFVHGSLRAKHVLIHGDLLTGKVAGIQSFPTTKDAPATSREYVPYRWMAPESFSKFEFSTASDVWAFGVLMWEVYTLGTLPYEAVSDEAIPSCIESGQRLLKPMSCNDDTYDVMVNCWKSSPTRRPNFHHIHREVSTMINTVSITIEN